MALAPLAIALARAAAARPEPRFLGSSLYRRAFGLGLTVGAVYFAGTLYWIPEVLARFGDLQIPVAVLVTGLLVAFLALFPAAWSLIVAFLFARLGAVGYVVMPAAWVGVELARAYVFGGFPWVLLGYSQVTILPVAQVASVTGVYGVSALVAGASAALAALVGAGTRRRRLVIAAGYGGLIVLLALWGAWRIAEGSLTRAGDPLRVALIQGNIEQDDKWNPALASSIFGVYAGMTRAAAAQSPRLIIWPESATPFYFEEDRAGRQAVEALAAEAGAHLLFGSDQVERDGGSRFYNSVFLVPPDGGPAWVYRKIHLVPFGEYVPFKQVLFFAEPLVESVSDFTPGTEPATLPMDGHQISTAICYEVIYPHLIGAFVGNGSELLTTVTNDAWYGRTSAPLQHFEQAAMRSIEQGRYLARSANTGVSGFVDPYGRVLARSRIFERETLTREVRLLHGRTVYGIIGDLFAYLCVAFTAVALAAGAWSRRAGRTRPWNAGRSKAWPS